MILQALASYYERLLHDPDVDVAEPGFSTEKIHYEILLGTDGALRAIDSIQQSPEKGSKLLPRLLKVPASVKRTVGVAANFLWDNSGYVLGADAKGNPERAREQFAGFRALAQAVGDDLDDDGMRAVLAFLEAWNPDEAASIPGWDDMAGKNMVFRLDGELGYVHNRPAVRAAWLRRLNAKSGGADFCLVTGKPSSAARLHPSIKGVRGAQSSGAALVSFNLDAFTSFGKEQNYNAPVSEGAVFAYTTALNHMLARGSDQKKQLGGTAEALRQAASGDTPSPSRRVLMVGDATTVFWTEKPTRAETDFLSFIDYKGGEEEGSEAHDGTVMQRLRDLVQAVAAGKEPPLWDQDKADTPFYILGLSPNAARLSVRFWYPSTVKVMMQRLGQHFVDLHIEKAYPKNPEFPSPWQLLIEAAPQHKTENIPPTLGGELMRAVITGSRYPKSLYTRVIARIRADQEVTYLRAALIKAFLNRSRRPGTASDTTTQTEVTVSLDPNNTNIGYLLGRLFAVLEKAQQDAIEGINATIKDRFYGAASATPRSVFPRLLHMAQHHISKSDYGYVSDILVAKITERMTAGQGFPAHLSLSDQGMFALGYYHQRNDNYRANEQKIEPVKEKK